MASDMWSLQDAKNKFSAVVEAALAGTPQEITRRGQPAVVVVSSASYERLLMEARTRRGSFVDHLMSAPTAPGDDERVERPSDVPRDVAY